MRTVPARLSGFRRRLVQDNEILANSSIMMVTTLMMAAAGSVFWIIAARLQPRVEVGIAGSLSSLCTALALFAQLGLNVSLIRTMSRSSRKRADVLGASALVLVVASVLGLTTATLLPLVSPRLGAVVHFPITAFVFALLVAGTALNLLTDSIFLGINQLWSNLKINGLLLSVTKCSLPFALAGAGAIGIFSAIGLSASIAGVASVVRIVSSLPGRMSLRPSVELLAARKFSGAGYLTNVLYFLPQMIFPIIVINASGAAEGALFFISFQVVAILNTGIYSVCNSMFAEGSRAPHRQREIAARGAMILLAATTVGVGVLLMLAPLLLSVFGGDYAKSGSDTLRIFGLGGFGVALNYWASMRLQMGSHHRSMVSVQLVTTLLMLGLALAVSTWGIDWVAGAWGLGQLAGGVLGCIVSRTAAPLVNTEPLTPETMAAGAHEKTHG